MIPKPLTNMAVSLSGGGYRATTFHLGALSYLNDLQFNGKSVLEEVKIISTISGGTFTGAMYALRLAQGKTYDDCFRDLYLVLRDEQLVDLALRKLNYPSKWKNSHKSKDLINAFSEVYNEVIYKGATFEDLYNGNSSHLTDVIFGSSEFTNGIQFRFQEEKGRGKFGNHFLNLPEEAAKKIRISDAVASSSCFPGGFEPLIMPIDYGNGPDSVVDKTWNGKTYKGKKYPKTAIMDGGIVDNQGIEGVKLAEKRHMEDDDAFIGTYIVSDVSGEFMKPYEVPVLKDGGIGNFFTIRGVNIFLAVLFVAISCVLYFVDLSTLQTVLLACFLPLIVVWFLVYFFVKSQLGKALEANFGKDQRDKLLKDFRVLIKTPIYILVYLIKFRVTSVLTMVSSIFLRRIRTLSLRSLYDSDDWNYRFKSNYIYKLEQRDLGLSEDMNKIIRAANTMPTTLWFTEAEYEKNVLDDLIACGQFTQCYNLMRYLEKIINGKYKEKVFDTLDPDYQNDLVAVHEKVKQDWEDFKSSPMWLFKKQLEKSGIGKVHIA